MKSHLRPQPPRPETNRDSNRIDLRNTIQEQYSDHPVPWFRWVFHRLALPPGGRLLELGCGSGALWRENPARIPAGSRLVLSDLELEMLRQARSNLSGLLPQPAFAGLDAQALPFAAETLDTILAVGLLDLVPDLPRTLREARRVLRPAGALLASAGGKDHLRELSDLLRPYLSSGPEPVLGGNEAHFGLENGGPILASYFDAVTRHDYRSRMAFTSLEPILDYVLSEQAVLQSLPQENLEPLIQGLQQNIARQGVIRVTIQKGLFVARKQGSRPAQG